MYLLLTIYCVLILLASIAGGLVPLVVKLTHAWMETAVSFVAGVMLGVAVLHLLPHALASDLSPHHVMQWLLFGFLAMFFIERFFCFHHHDVPTGHHDHETHQTHHQVHHAADEHHHDLTWSGAALGLVLHSVIGGVALAASVNAEWTDVGHVGQLTKNWAAGLSTFLVIFLHKPFDSLTIGTLMARGGWSLAWRHTVNALFSLAIPAGVLAFQLGLAGASVDPASSGTLIPRALAFSAGTFLCVSLSDLLPELQFHQHDRFKLSAALLLGLGLAFLLGHPM